MLCAWICGLLYRRFYQHRLLLLGIAVLLSGAMLLGRLEIYPLLITLTPTAWAKRR